MEVNRFLTPKKETYIRMKKILFLLSACGLVLPSMAEDKVPRIPSPKGAKVMIVLMIH